MEQNLLTIDLTIDTNFTKLGNGIAIFKNVLGEQILRSVLKV